VSLKASLECCSTLNALSPLSIEHRIFGEMNRHAATGALGDRIERGRSGNAEWQRPTKSNNSFNPTGNSGAFIEKLDGFGVVVRRVNSGVRRNMRISQVSKGSMKQKFIIIIVTLCILIFSNSPTRSNNVQDHEESLDSVVITPTDWNSLKDIEMLEDDCNPKKKCESCPGSLPKPKTTMESGLQISDCIGVGKVLTAYQPCYPKIAKAAKAFGVVHVMVVVDENGKVIWAHVWKGHPLLQFAAVRAACKWRFEPALCGSEKQKVNRMISFNFKGSE
jgi:TonB family protein